jgi:hypothetical protein
MYASEKFVLFRGDDERLWSKSEMEQMEFIVSPTQNMSLALNLSELALVWE